MAVILAIIIFGGAFMFAVIRDENQSKKTLSLIEAAREAYSFRDDYLNKVLVVKKKSDIASEVIKVNASRDVNVTHVPDKIIYTGATVGGVTTGGFHVQEGGNRVRLGAKNGDYFLTYEFAKTNSRTMQHESSIVSYIDLSDELYREAENDPILRDLIIPVDSTKRKTLGYGVADIKNLLDVGGTLDATTANYIVSWLSK